MAAEDTERGGGRGEGGVSTIGADDDDEEDATVSMAGPNTRVRTSSMTLSGALCEVKKVKNI